MLDRLSTIEDRYDELDQLLTRPEVASDYSVAQKYAKEQSSLKEIVDLTRKYRSLIEQLAEVKEMIQSEADPDVISMVKEEQDSLEDVKNKVENQIRLALVPKDPNDQKNVIMEIRAGTGGDEAGLFASDLYRMYSRLAQRLKWKVEVIDSSSTGIGGIKEITFQVNGNQAYSKLKHESGVHRVQRVPSTEYLSC